MKSSDLQTVQGEALDRIAALYGVSRRYYETDVQLREYLLGMLHAMNNPRNFFGATTGRYSGSQTTTFSDSHGNPISAVRDNPHAKHDVVENHALGKKFLYCRQCKVEVNE